MQLNFIQTNENKMKRQVQSRWNHRVLAFAEKHELLFEVCRVYYDDRKPMGYARSTTVFGETKKEIRWTLRHMRKALRNPILWGGERFPEEFNAWNTTH